MTIAFCKEPIKNTVNKAMVINASSVWLNTGNNRLGGSGVKFVGKKFDAF